MSEEKSKERTKSRKNETREGGIYLLSDDELSAIADSRQGKFALDSDVAAFWKRHEIG